MWLKWWKVLQKGRKCCGKRRNCSWRAISPFHTAYSKTCTADTLKPGLVWETAKQIHGRIIKRQCRHWVDGCWPLLTTFSTSNLVVTYRYMLHDGASTGKVSEKQWSAVIYRYGPCVGKKEGNTFPWSTKLNESLHDYRWTKSFLFSDRWLNHEA